MGIINLIFGYFIGKSLAMEINEIEDQKEKQKRKEVLDEVEGIIFQLYSTKQPITIKVVAEKMKIENREVVPYFNRLQTKQIIRKPTKKELNERLYNLGEYIWIR